MEISEVQPAPKASRAASSKAKPAGKLKSVAPKTRSAMKKSQKAKSKEFVEDSDDNMGKEEETEVIGESIIFPSLSNVLRNI